jgi:DNA-directed RNA polymerase II subunit RPB4
VRQSVNEFRRWVNARMNNSNAQQQENVAELQFGSGNDFVDIQVLSNAQVAVILQVSASSAMQDRDEELHSVYRKTQHYVNRFNNQMTNPTKEHQELLDELDNLQE